MEKVRIKVPLHITGFWKPIYTRDPITTGSLGAGLNIDSYLIADIMKSSRSTIILNDKEINIPTVKRVLKYLKSPITIKAYTRAILGAGYGLSAALALAASIGTTIVYGMKISLEKAASIAHIAEVEEATGLGDVIAMYYGGFEVRVKPGPPGIGEIIKIPYDPSIKIITLILGKYDTPSMLRRYGIKQYIMAENCLKELLSYPDLQYFLELSRAFTKTFFNYNEVEKIIDPIKKYLIGYYLKKKVLVMAIEKDHINDVVEYLNHKKIRHIISSISSNGISLEESSLNQL